MYCFNSTTLETPVSYEENLYLSLYTYIYIYLIVILAFCDSARQTIANHNNHLLQGHNHKKETPNNVKLCNCREKASCPLNGKCLAKCVINKATVTETTTKNQESCIGLTDNEFKTRCNQHKSSFKLVHRRNHTKLSEHIWELRDRNIEHTIQWEIFFKKSDHIHQKKACANFVWKKNIKF